MVSAAGPQLFQSCWTQSGAGSETLFGRAVAVVVGEGTSVGVAVLVPGGSGEAVWVGSGVGDGEGTCDGATKTGPGVGIASTGFATPRKYV